MAWTTPSTRTTGTLITASIWNTDVVANLIYLKSKSDRRVIHMRVIPHQVAVTVGNNKETFHVPAALNGMNLVDFDVGVDTPSTSGLPTFQLYNVTDSQDMLSTRATIDANENNSFTAATPPVINTSYDDLATGDILRADIDVAGTGTKGTVYLMECLLP